MKMVDTKGKALGRQYYCPKDDKKLSNDELVRGFETEDGKMIVVEDEELDAIAPDLTRDIELRRFVPIDQIPPVYYDRPYFLAPAGKSDKAYHLLAETMERTKRVGVGSFVMRTHEYLVAIISEGGVLRAETLRFGNELHTPQDVGLPKRAKRSASRITAFTKAVAGLTKDKLDTTELADQYAEAIQELVRTKEKKRQDVVSAAGAEDADSEGCGKVIHLMQVLRQSLSAKATVTTAAPGAPADDETGQSAAKTTKKSATVHNIKDARHKARATPATRNKSAGRSTRRKSRTRR